jgi:sensor histidine kinase YesM
MDMDRSATDLPPAGPPSWRGLRHCLLPLQLFNAAIALLLTILDFGGGLGTNLVFSFSVGNSIALVHVPLLLRTPADWRRWLTLLFSLPASVAAGLFLARLLSGFPVAPGSPLYWQSLAVGLIFGLIGTVAFLLAQRINQLDEEVNRRRLAEEAQARRETEARLKLLRAQIEPHFLFNTLANVGSLIDADPPRARRLLDRLNDWLRASLAQSRKDATRLEDELVWLENWLEILRERFGSRLNWSIDASSEARAMPFPALLLQPLVENAVKHGIEPKLGGGHLTLRARLEAGHLLIEVEDDGIGMTNPGTGTGLANVRERLAALHDGAARLSLRANPAGGVTSRLELPCAR